MRRVDTVFTGLAGAPYFNSLFFDPEGSFGTAQGAIDDVDDFWNTLLPSMGTDITYSVQSEVTIIDPPTGEPTGTEVGTGVSRDGYTAGTLLPPATQGLIRWLTGSYIGGRQVRGRTFIPGVVAAASDASGNPTGGLVANAATAIAALNSSTQVFCIYSRPRVATETLPARAGSAYAVSGGSLWNQFAVLRSRRD